MKNVKYFFLGGIFSGSQIGFVRGNSIGVVQNAADALQKKIVGGLDELISNGVCIINLPFVGSYPRLFKSAYFPGTNDSIGSRSIVKGIGFVNIFFLKIFFRFSSAFYALIRFCSKDDIVLFIYSAHLPFIISSIFLRSINPSVKICLILPDLPEFMGDGSFFYRTFKRIDSTLFYFLAKKLDFFVVLTKFMAEKMQIDMRKVVVIEGVASPSGCNAIDLTTRQQQVRSFLYTGTLARRYGIIDLIDAFSKIDTHTLELWICGDGDGKDYVTAATMRDNRIKYFGQIGRDEVIKLQGEASVLMNPRTPEGEFTKYSFPSKVMEYMASGRPVIMYKLDGIPEEYDPYYISPNGIGVDALAQCMQHVAGMSNDQLIKIGREAREFVLKEKNPLKQAKKILDLVMENHK